MISGSLTQAQYRSAILAEIASAYRRIRGLELELKQKRFTRVFKNRRCRGAERQAEAREDVEASIGESESDLVMHWKLLPEVPHTGVYDMLELKAFAAKLCARKRNPKYLKNQRHLLD